MQELKIRIPDKLHKVLVQQAKKKKMTLNSYTEMMLRLGLLTNNVLNKYIKNQT